MHRNNSDTNSFHYYSERLRKKLGLLGASKAAIIEAPSGYGKTTAIRDHLKFAAKQGDQVYWFTAVDEAPSSLYRRLCREIGKIDICAGERLSEFDFPNAFTIGDVCDAIRTIECNRNTWLAIDDFRFLVAVLPPSFLAALLDHGGDKLHVIIITQPMGQEFLSTVAARGLPHVTAYDLQWEAEDIYRYFSIAGPEISHGAAREVKKNTDGWVIAVYLQLCSWRETGAFSDDAVNQLIDHLIWNKMTAEQQEFFMLISPFDTYTTRQMCGVLGCDTLPDYVADSLTIPFINYDADQQRYVPHAIISEFFRAKRRERGGSFERGCMLKAGDIYRNEGQIAKALFFYALIDDYERVLSLELSYFVCAEIGDRMFYDIAVEITKNCPAAIRREYPLSMLCVAWAVRLLEMHDEFGALMDELDALLPKTGPLRAEWLLLSVYTHFPYLDKMLPTVREAAALFNGARSRVILPEAPWAFYEYLQLTAFHTQAGAADTEADMLEEFMDAYSRLTGGHGSGADALFRAELAFFRCETSKAEILAYKASFLAKSKGQKIIQTGATKLLASIAILKADANNWQYAVDAMESVASGSSQNTREFRFVLDVVRGTLLAELRDFASVPDWLKSVDFISWRQPVSIIKNALVVHTLYSIGRGDHARLIGLGEALPFQCYSVFSEHIRLLVRAIELSELGDKEQAFAYMEQSARLGLPDGMLHYYVVFSLLLQGLTDELIEKSYPHIFERFKDYKEQYITGWYKVYNAIVAEELPSGLTAREREIALLAAEGLRNNEIAEKLFVSENTVRAHLRAIYQKLDIDRRAQLAKKLR